MNIEELRKVIGMKVVFVDEYCGEQLGTVQSVEIRVDSLVIIVHENGPTLVK